MEEDLVHTTVKLGSSDSSNSLVSTSPQGSVGAYSERGTEFHYIHFQRRLGQIDTRVSTAHTNCGTTQHCRRETNRYEVSVRKVDTYRDVSGQEYIDGLLPVDENFPVTGQVVTVTRSRLHPETMTLLVFLHESLPVHHEINFQRFLVTVKMDEVVEIPGDK